MKIEAEHHAKNTIVLTVNRVGFIGGVERVLIACATHVRQRGVHTVLACPPEGGLLEAATAAGIEAQALHVDRTKATYSPATWLRQWHAFRRGSAAVVELAGRLRPDVIHVHHPVGGLYAAAACAKLGIPLLLHVHEVLPLKPLYALAARRVLPSCNAIVCVSGASKALMRRLGVTEDRMQTIHNGVSAAFLRPVERCVELRGTARNVGLFGVIEPRKGQNYFIEAAIRLKDSHPDVHFWIVGGLSFAEHASYEASLRQQAAGAGMAERVHFTGHRADIAAWMAGMDVVTLASVAFESLPTVLIEAAVLDRAIVATDVGSVREIVEDNATGLVVKPADDAAMAASIARMLSPEGQEFGKRAGVDARHRFSPERFAEQMVDVYTALIRPSAAMGTAA